MKTFVYCNQKGGVGKSTFAVHHAIWVHQQDQRVLVIDLDGQGNSSSSLCAMSHTVLDAVDLFSSDKAFTSSHFCLMQGDQRLNDIERLPNNVVSHFKSHMEKFQGSYDYCIIDTSPTLGLRLMAALMVSDFVVCPIELAGYSIQGLSQIITTIQGMKERYNHKLKFLGFFANRVNSQSNAHRNAMREICNVFSQYIIQKTMVNRIAVQEALDQGCAVWDLKSRSALIAAQEMIDIIEAVELLAQDKDASLCLQTN